MNEVIKKIEPKDNEKKKILRIIKEITSLLKSASSEYNLDIKIEVGGSIGKQTWISGEADIDIFILFPLNVSLDTLTSLGLSMARDVIRKIGGEIIEKYAQHPYIESNIDGIIVDIVPAFHIKDSSQIRTAADRSSLHVRYVNAKLDEKMRREVKILKKFLKGINVYGSEIKTQGFSGYLCELLIIYYRSFTNLLRNAIHWIPWKTLIDIENFYENKEEAFKRFKNPLIVIDPVDKNRNAAAAVSLEKLLEFKTACKFFLKNPSISFFFPKPINPITLSEFREIIRHRNTRIVFILLPIKKISPDIIWGIGLKIAKKLRNISERYDFRILDTGVWTDEREALVLLFEVENICLPYVKRHIGPLVGSSNEIDFLKKYLEMGEVIAGPYIEGRRWIVYKPRKYTDFCVLLRENIYQVSNLEKILREKKIAILLDEEIFNAIKREEFLIYLRKWITKKYKWIKI